MWWKKKEIAHRRVHLIPENSSPENVLWGHKATNSWFKGRVSFRSREIQDCQLKSSISNSGAKRFFLPLLFLFCNLPRYYGNLSQWNLLLISVYGADFENFVTFSDLKPWQAWWKIPMFSIQEAPWVITCIQNKKQKYEPITMSLFKTCLYRLCFQGFNYPLILTHFEDSKI